MPSDWLRDRQDTVAWLRGVADQIERGDIDTVDVSIHTPQPESRHYVPLVGPPLSLPPGFSVLSVRIGPSGQGQGAPDPDALKETMEDHLRKMQADLGSLVSRMNRDDQPQVALKAQLALIALVALEEEFDADCFAWDWEPVA